MIALLSRPIESAIKEMSDLTGIQVFDIDDICNKKISYELNFLIGNICDMLDNDMSTEIERLKDMLNILQKRVKYGVATKTAVSICETIFNDRVLATKLTNIIGDDIERKGFHSLRHTFATRALECGMDVKTLAEILGHKNATVTLNRYAHSLMEHKQDMMNKLGKIFN